MSVAAPEITQHKILIVDDEPLLKSIIMQKFKQQIKDHELIFIFAINGVDALKKLNDDPEIGIVLTDINMPEMDGLTLLSNLVKQNRFYRTVVVSAYSDMANIRVAMNRGASDFITKPINLNDLEITVKKTIEQYEGIKLGLMAQKQIIEIQNELKIASQIQQAFIPHSFNPFPENTHVEVLGEMLPAQEIGGDFFDFFPIDKERLGFVIADVAGKGIPAAIFMAMCRTLIRATAFISESSSNCIEQVNRILSINNEQLMFVTAFYGILNINTGELKYCNAGHNPPYLIGADGSLSLLGKNQGIALGISEHIELSAPFYQENTILMKKGETLFLYTDGVIDAVNTQDTFYQTQRLEHLLQDTHLETIKKMVNAVKLDLKNFIGTAQQSDDITLFCIRYNGNE